MSALLELADRLEQATGADILELLNLHCDICRELGIASEDQVSAFPVSLDASLTLVPDVNDQSAYPQVSRYTPVSWRAHIGYANKAVGVVSEAATPALALCAASLRARAAGCDK